MDNEEKRELMETITKCRMDIAELKGMLTMHLKDNVHHTPPCQFASNTNKTLYTAAGAAFMSMLSFIASLIFIIIRG